jgi:hypothetical protein
MPVSHRDARPLARALATIAAAAALAPAAAFAADTTPVVLTFSTVGDSRQDPNTYDQASVGATLDGQDATYLQNTKAFARILRTIQSQKSQILFFNGDMINGYGWAAYGYTSNATQSAITGPVAPATTADIVGSDLMKHYREYAFWRGLVAGTMEQGVYVFPVPGNHETECKACPVNADGQKQSKVENEQAYVASMGDLVVDSARFAGIVGSAPTNINYGPAAGASPDSLTTDQSKLSYSFDWQNLHFAVINTDPVGQETSAPAQWLAADFAAASGRGAKKFFVFGHKPAFTYAYAPGVSGSGLDATPATTARRNAFWNVIEQYRATYFCGHQHTYHVSQPLGGAYQVVVGSGGSPFDPKASQAAAGQLANPATDRDYAWATVKVHADGGIDILGYGFPANFGPTQLIGQYFIAP